MDNDQLKDELEKWLMVMELRMTDKITSKITDAMTARFNKIDARLDQIDGHILSRELDHLAIADRHHGLAVTVELMQIEGRHLQASVARLERGIADLLEVSRRHEARLGKLEGDAA
jgi:hypothetical protein